MSAYLILTEDEDESVMGMARGMVDMMNEDQRALIAFGILDSELMNSFERQMKEKYDRVFTAVYEMSPEDMDKDSALFKAVEDRKETVRHFVNAVSRKIYAVAAKRNMMVV